MQHQMVRVSIVLFFCSILRQFHWNLSIICWIFNLLYCKPRKFHRMLLAEVNDKFTTLVFHSISDDVNAYTHYKY